MALLRLSRSRLARTLFSKCCQLTDCRCVAAVPALDCLACLVHQTDTKVAAASCRAWKG